MVALRPRDVDAYLKRPDAAHKVILIYGPDRGLVSERALQLAKASGIDLDDPFSTVKLSADDATAEPTRLADEAYTVSMFGDRRLIWISGSTARNLANAVQPLLDTPPEDALVIIEAGDLAKSSALRGRVERAPSAAAIACYPDQGAALDQLIDEETRAHGLAMDRDARALLKTLLGADRMASRNEIAKLCLYCLDQDQIGLADVEAVVSNAAGLAVNQVVDATANGGIDAMEGLLRRLIDTGSSPVQISLALQQHFQTLHAMKAEMTRTGQNAARMVDTARPPIHFQRKDAVRSALERWSLVGLTRALSRLDRTALDVRVQAMLAPQLLATTMLALSIEARRGR